VTKTEQRIAELERQVAGFAAEIRDLREEAAVVRTIGEMTIQMQTGHLRALPPERPVRHLHAVGGPR
jgi:hypothetical protein